MQKKEAVALDLIAQWHRRRQAVAPTQVVQEYFATATRRLGVSVEIARHKTELFARVHLFRPGTEDIPAAVDLHRLYGISFWDSLIVRAALATHCVRLLTADLQHRQRIASLEIVNPFL